MEEIAISHGTRTLPEKSPRHPAKERYDLWCVSIFVVGDGPWEAVFLDPSGSSWQEDFRAKGYRLN